MSKKIFILLVTALLVMGAGCAKNRNVISASGTAEVKEVDLASRISSRVTKLLVDDGSAVKKNDLLAELDDNIVRAQRDMADAVHSQAKDNYERTKQLYESKSVSQQQYEQAQAAYLNARASLDQAQIMLKESRVYAPWDGTILRKNTEVGEIVSANTPLFTLGDLATIKITIYIPLKELGLVKLNQPARVKVDSFNKYFTGKVTFISSEAEFTPKNIQTKDERVKEVFAVEVTAANPDNELKPGMPADVEIDTK
jgi:HlyD family secretion protein